MSDSRPNLLMEKPNTKGTHAKLVWPASKRQKRGAGCAPVHIFHNLFSTVKFMPQEPQLLLIRVQGGRFKGPTPVHAAFKPQCWVSNNDVSLCTYATGSGITHKESRRVYRKGLLWYNTGTV